MLFRQVAEEVVLRAVDICAWLCNRRKYMNPSKYVFLSILFIGVALLSGCFAQQLPADEVKKYADQMTENILVAMNEDDYARFSRDFDEQMKTGLNKTQYDNTIPGITAKIGKYISKEYLSAEKKDGYTVVVYKARFSQEPGDVIVRSVFKGSDGKMYISGFWLDSPKLRGN